MERGQIRAPGPRIKRNKLKFYFSYRLAFFAGTCLNHKDGSSEMSKVRGTHRTRSSVFALLRVERFHVKRTAMLSRKRNHAGTSRILDCGSLLRKFRVFQQERLHIGDDEAWVERSRTVDIPDATFPID